MNIVSLRAELLKTRRTSSWNVCLIAAAIMPLMLILEDGDSTSASFIKDPWNHFFAEGRQGWIILLLPMYIILICTLIPQLEYKNNTWKQVLSSPQKKRDILLSKFAIVHLLILVFFISYNILLASSLVIIDFLNPNINLMEHSMNWKYLIQSNIKAYFSILAISAIQFWLGMRFRNFITPIAIGFALWLAGALIIFEFQWTKTYLFPFTYPLLTELEKHKPLVSLMTWFSVGYAIAFLVIAYYDFQSRRMQ